jgi:hypothetical protein
MMQINFHSSWILSVLIYIFLVYVIVTVFLGEDFLIIIVPLMLVSALGITTSLAVNLAQHYKDKSRRFYYSSAFLAIALGAYTIGETLWTVFDFILLIDPYPSLADPFYMVYFGASIMFCVKVFYCRKELITFKAKAISLAAGVTIFSAYLILAWDNLDYEYFWLDTFFMVLSSLLITNAMMATLTAMKAPKLKRVWMVLGTALALNSIADLFYYSNTQEYFYADFPNIIWFGTVLMFFYAMYLHRFLFLKLDFQR